MTPCRSTTASPRVRHRPPRDKKGHIESALDTHPAEKAAAASIYRRQNCCLQCRGVGDATPHHDAEAIAVEEALCLFETCRLSGVESKFEVSVQLVRSDDCVRCHAHTPV